MPGRMRTGEVNLGTCVIWANYWGVMKSGWREIFYISRTHQNNPTPAPLVYGLK